MARKLLLLVGILAQVAFSTTPADVSPDTLLEAGHWKRLRRMVEPKAANSQDAQSAFFLSCARMAFGDLDGALEMAERAVSLEPASSRYHQQLAVVYGRKANKASFFKKMSLGGQYKTEIKKAVDLDPRNIDALWELMEFYWNAPGIAGGDQTRAHSLAEDIMHLNAARGYLALAELATPGKQDADIEDFYRKAAQADPKSYEAQMRLAGFYLSDNQKKYDVADRYAQQAISIDPGRIGGYKVMAVVRAHAERWQELDGVLALAETRVPDDLGAYFHAGQETLLAGKDPKRAEQYLRKYLTQEPEAYAPHLSRAHWRIGQALIKQGRKTEAISALETALRLEPGLDGARNDLKTLK